MFHSKKRIILREFYQISQLILSGLLLREVKPLTLFMLVIFIQISFMLRAQMQSVLNPYAVELILEHQLKERKQVNIGEHQQFVIYLREQSIRWSNLWRMKLLIQIERPTCFGLAIQSHMIFGSKDKTTIYRIVEDWQKNSLRQAWILNSFLKLVIMKLILLMNMIILQKLMAVSDNNLLVCGDIG